jgi:bifunctional non-homologous end joining protein LigD
MLRLRPRRAPSGFIEPCLPTPVPQPPSGRGWMHEIKHDGYRMMVRRDAAGVRLLTRGGYDWASRFPLVAEAVNMLPVKSCLLDGELVACNEARLSVFAILRRREAERSAFLYAFDLIELDGRDLRREPIETRKRELARMPSRPMTSASKPPYVVFGAASAQPRARRHRPPPSVSFPWRWAPATD